MRASAAGVPGPSGDGPVRARVHGSATASQLGSWGESGSDSGGAAEAAVGYVEAVPGEGERSLRTGEEHRGEVEGLCAVPREPELRVQQPVPTHGGLPGLLRAPRSSLSGVRAEGS
mgnify:CR=1 FL=1